MSKTQHDTNVVFVKVHLDSESREYAERLDAEFISEETCKVMKILEKSTLSRPFHSHKKKRAKINAS